MSEKIKWLGGVNCDVCHRDVTRVGETFRDCKTKFGPWGLLCCECSPAIDTGLGQTYDSKTKEKIS